MQGLAAAECSRMRCDKGGSASGASRAPCVLECNGTAHIRTFAAFAFMMVEREAVHLERSGYICTQKMRVGGAAVIEAANAAQAAILVEIERPRKLFEVVLRVDARSDG